MHRTLVLRISACAALALALASCAPATMQTLREQSAGQLSFSIDQGYQQVYRTVLTNARRCFQANFVSAQVIVQGDLYPDLFAGEVTVAMHGAMGVDTYLGIDVKGGVAGSTAVKVYHAFGTWARRAEAVQGWLAGSTACEA